MLRTKVIATIGPASSSPEVAASLLASGVDVARINMSHGAHDTHERSIRSVREASAKVGRPVAILVDLQGPKIRIGKIKELIPVREGSQRHDCP